MQITLAQKSIHRGTSVSDIQRLDLIGCPHDNDLLDLCGFIRLYDERSAEPSLRPPPFYIPKCSRYSGYGERSSISHMSSHAGPASTTESRSCQTIERSPSSRTRHRQNRGRHCGRHPNENSQVSNRSKGSVYPGAYDGKVATNGARRRGERVRGTEQLAADLDNLTTFPDHGADWPAAHIYSPLSALCTNNALHRWKSTHK